MSKTENTQLGWRKINGLKVAYGILGNKIKGKPDVKINHAKSIFSADWVEKDGDSVNRRIEFINTINK